MRKITVIIPLFLSFTLGQNDIYERKYQSDPDFDIDVQHYNISLQIYDHIKSFTGKTSVTFEIKKPNLKSIKLDVETVTITDVIEGNQPRKFIQKNGQLLIDPKGMLQLGEIIQYTIYYDSEGKVADPAQFNMGGVKVLGIGFFDESEDNPQLVQSHSFPTGARHWFPSNDHPADKATSRITTTVRKDWKVLANGLLTDQITVGDSATYTWDLDLPNSTYLYVMVAGPFEVIQDYHGDIPISYWVYPRDKQNAVRSFERTSEIMAFLEEEYGVPFPWPKMDQITIPGIGGGAESTTATILGHNTIHDAKADKDFPSHWLVAHEAAHQWWGDYITMGNWHHAWLNESFGTYGEYLYSAHLKGYDEGQINLWKKKQAYLREYRNRYSRPMVHPYWDWPNQNFDSHIYPRGAAVLHMLRQIIGDENMKAFQKSFLTQFAYGNPKTEDLFRVVNETVSQDLSWFFDQWVMSAGHPQIDVKTESHDGILTIWIDQTQTGRNTPSHYRLPIEIDIYFSNRVDRKSILVDDRNTIHRFKTKVEPVLVRIDPDDHLLIELNQSKTKEGLLVQLKKDNVIGRREAAMALIVHLSDDKVVKALKRSAFHDKAWFVRQGAFSILKKHLSKKEWIRAYKRESHSQPRKTIITQFSKAYPKSAAELIRNNLDQDDSYIVQAEMIQQLGHIGNDKDIHLVKSYIPPWSPRKIVRRAANNAITVLKEK
ncbi:MAG: M1 family metallopeptidase [Candidatus Marinimicrobia bacterium]|jgi:aminopeptidase N|nr:M1 family metallopeptidase [Candidatus Neomarinimicrobiota bacterium]MDP6611637.1 M1 family metallopeptidase [Candidatus Neomarinimicrobiota bacterium]|tara:strand:- start:28397 stop:30535 length:2139 start_codon:yes stop_codon:yes gene_type:complete